MKNGVAVCVCTEMFDSEDFFYHIDDCPKFLALSSLKRAYIKNFEKFRKDMDEIQALKTVYNFANYKIPPGQKYSPVPCISCRTSKEHKENKCLPELGVVSFTTRAEKIRVKALKHLQKYAGAEYKESAESIEEDLDIIRTVIDPSISDEELETILSAGFHSYIKRPDGTLLRAIVIKVEEKKAAEVAFQKTIQKKQEELTKCIENGAKFLEQINAQVCSKWLAKWEKYEKIEEAMLLLQFHRNLTKEESESDE